MVIAIIGVLRALTLGLVLFLIYEWLLTRPLTKLIEHLARINPDRPGAHKLPLIKGHERNELGLWVETANSLLAAIEHNMQLRQQAESSLQHMTQYDPLTGLPNRQQLQRQLDHILEEARRLQRRVAVLCLGLDDFKGINEQFSYRTGDHLLLALADRLRSLGGRLDALARLGGDQFVLVLSGIEQPYEAAELAQTLLDDLETPLEVDGQRIRLHGTIGVTLYPEDGGDTEKLLQKAEQTMTLAKNRSRNRYQFYVASIDSEMRARRELEKDLGEALAHGEFFLVYQPQVDYQRNCITGVEALLRWKHQGKLVPPDLFIPVAEQNGSIIPIGAWVLDQACRQLQEWRGLGFTGLRMAVNLSTVQLHHSGLPQMISDLLQRHQLPAETLELEVTETGLMEDIQAARHNLLSLRRSGALIAIDDFGTGYLLAQLPQEPAAGQDQDRQEFRSGHRPGRRRHHRSRSHSAGPQPGHDGHRRRRGDAGAGSLSDRRGLPGRPGLLLQQAAAGTGNDRAAAAVPPLHPHAQFNPAVERYQPLTPSCKASHSAPPRQASAPAAACQ
ncbi:hypothetical protein SSTU70S_04751 [Stutzerimonas stutzeri]